MPTHLDEYKAAHEEITLFQREMHRTWVWAIMPAGVVYTWLASHPLPSGVLKSLWFIPAVILLICYKRYEAFNWRIEVLANYLLEIEEGAFGTAMNVELRGMAHYNREHSDPKKLVRHARWAWWGLIAASLVLSSWLFFSPPSQPTNDRPALPQTNTNNSLNISLQPATITPINDRSVSLQARSNNSAFKPPQPITNTPVK